MTQSSEVKICDEARMSEREMRALQEKVVVYLCSSRMVQNEVMQIVCFALLVHQVAMFLIVRV